MKKLSPALIISSLFCFTFHQSSFGFESNSQKIATLEEQIGQMQSTLEKIKMDNTLGESGGSLAPNSPLVDGDHYGLGIDVLYWSARLDGTAYVYTNNTTTSAPPIDGELEDISMNWAWGFKVEAERFFEFDRWFVDTTFTYFRPRGSNTTASTASSSRIPLQGLLLANIPVDHADSELALDYYLLDLILQKQVSFTKNFGVGLGIGLASEWLSLSQLTRYYGGSYLQGDTVTIDTESKIWGMGPKAVIDTDWYLGRGIHISCSFSPSCIYGYVDGTLDESRSRITTDSNLMREKKHRFFPMFGALVGLSWQDYINENKQFLTVKLAYELTYLFSQNTMLYVSDLSAGRYKSLNEDIGFQGITLQVGISF